MLPAAPTNCVPLHPQLAPPGPAETLKVIAALPLLLELAASAQPDTALAAAHCLLKAAHLHHADAAAVLAAPESMALLTSLLDPSAAGAAGGEQPPAPLEQAPRGEPVFNTDRAPLLLLVLASVVECRPELLRQYGSTLRPAVSACLAAVGDPGLKRRWAKLLAR